MSNAIFKFKTSEIALPSAANTINLATCVRLINANTTSKHVITLISNSVNTTFTILPSTELLVQKISTDTLQVDTGSDVLVSQIAFRT